MENPEDYYVSYREVAARMHKQVQYAIRYVDPIYGRYGYPYLGDGIRLQNTEKGDYHAVKIHKDDIDELVNRYENYLEEIRK